MRRPDFGFILRRTPAALVSLLLASIAAGMAAYPLRMLALASVACWLAWMAGRREAASSQPTLGIVAPFALLVSLLPALWMPDGRIGPLIMLVCGSLFGLAAIASSLESSKLASLLACASSLLFGLASGHQLGLWSVLPAVPAGYLGGILGARLLTGTPSQRQPLRDPMLMFAAALSLGLLSTLVAWLWVPELAPVASVLVGCGFGCFLIGPFLISVPAAPRSNLPLEPHDASLPVACYRGFLLSELQEVKDGIPHVRYTLGPLNSGFPGRWISSEMVASCPHGCPQPPGDRCQCGLYAVHQVEQLSRWPVHAQPCPHCVIAAAIAFGSVLEHPEGVRASNLQLVAIINRGTYKRPDRFAAAVAEQYHLPLLSYEGAAALLAEHGTTLPGTVSADNRV